MLWLLHSLPRRAQLLRIVPLAALNSGVLGTVLVERTQSFTLGQSLGFGLGSGLGYVLAVLLVTEARHRLRSKAIPKAFPRPAHHAGVYRRAGAGDLWLYRTFRHPVMQTGRKEYHG